VEYNLCTATGVWKDLMTARFGSDVTFRTKLGYFILDGILHPNNHKNENYTINEDYHHHKHQGLDPLIRSVSRVTAARANASSVFQLFSFLVVCSGMYSKGFGFVAFFASVKASSVCIHPSCTVCL